MKSVKLRAFGLALNWLEKFQTRTAMTAMTIQNTRLRSVEFKSTLPSPLGKTRNCYIRVSLPLAGSWQRVLTFAIRLAAIGYQL
jgi:hypothetical protein